MRTLSWSVLPPTILTATCGAVLAACGSSGGAAKTNANSALQFSECMRSRGVTNFPDPGSGGNNFIGPGSGINPRSPAFQAAQKACAKFGGGGPGQIHMTEAQKLAALRFAECMRSHGEPNFPDPTYKPSAGGRLILALRGMFFPIPAGLNPMDPAFRQAAIACGLKLPSGPPTKAPAG
jgi:hypothetical protein